MSEYFETYSRKFTKSDFKRAESNTNRTSNQAENKGQKAKLYTLSYGREIICINVPYPVCVSVKNKKKATGNYQNKVFTIKPNL